MNISLILLFVTFACVTWNILTGLKIRNYLRDMGTKPDSWVLKFMTPEFVDQYKGIVLAETGKPGVLYYHFMIPLYLALLTGGATVLASII